MELQKTITVGIVEDHKLLREIVGSLLHEAGIEVSISCSDPNEFMERVRISPPEVALVDLTLESPDGFTRYDGLDVVRALSAQHPAVRTLVLSARRGPDVVKRTMDSGAWGFLDKVVASDGGVITSIRSVAAGQKVVATPTVEQISTRPAPSKSNRLGAAGVTPREREVLAEIGVAADNRSIAARLGISERTVKAHVTALYTKLGCENRVELAIIARELGA